MTINQLPTPEEAMKSDYDDYVKNGDPFFMDGLSFDKYSAIKNNIMRRMSKDGAS